MDPILQVVVESMEEVKDRLEDDGDEEDDR